MKPRKETFPGDLRTNSRDIPFFARESEAIVRTVLLRWIAAHLSAIQIGESGFAENDYPCNRINK